MRNILLLMLILASALIAKSSIVSTVSLPQSYVLNLSEKECDSWCLEDLVAQHKVFTFLAIFAEQNIEDEHLKEQYAVYVAMLNLSNNQTDGSLVKIAMMVPEKVIGRYAMSTTRSALAYLLSRDRDIEFKTFLMGDESRESIDMVLEEIEQGGFSYVIAPMTKKGAASVAQSNSSLKIFFPTVHKDDLNQSSPMLYFGGINYGDQIDKLMELASAPLVIFYDDSELGMRLKEQTQEKFLAKLEQGNPFDYIEKSNQIYSYKIGKKRTNLKQILDKNSKIVNGTFFLHTPLIKSSMITSQITLYERNATAILSTQINYTPKLFEMTQDRDRKEMFVASSIGYQNDSLIDKLSLLGVDVTYNWINHATVIGADYFYSLLSGESRELSVAIQNNQVQYQPELFRASRDHFVIKDDE